MSEAGFGPTRSPNSYSLLQEVVDATVACCVFAQDAVEALWPSQHVGSQDAELAFCASSTDPPASATMNARVARIRFIAILR